MAKVTLDDLSTTLANSAAATLNANNTKLEAALEKTLSRDGTGPNQMEADFDLNHNDILNVDNIHADVLVLNGQTVTPTDLAALPATVMLKTTYDPGGKGSNAFDSANQDFLNSGDGVAARSVQSRLRDTLSVKDVPGVTGDGATVDQAGLVAAVANALLTGRDLYWPAGTYVSNASIPSFHSVRHTGPGIVKRGSGLFYVQPRGSQSNTVYVATSGSSANDGLSASEPMATFQNAFDALKNYGPVLDGNWNVVAAAGTYTINAGAHSHTTPSKNRVTIRGPVTGHPNVPTCIVDGTGGGDYQHGISISGIGVRVAVRDIKFQNFVSNNTRIGLSGEQESDFYTDNVHASNCDWVGLYAFNTIRARMSGGILDGCRFGFLANDTQATLGYGASTTAEGTIIRNCTESGVGWSRGAQGHVDYCVFEDNVIGLNISENARVDTLGGDFKRNTIAIRTRTGGTFVEGGSPNVFNNGTADANTTNVDYKAYSGDTSELDIGTSWFRAAYDRALRSASGTTPATLATPYTIKAKRLQGAGKQCRVVVAGIWPAVTASSTITVNFGGMAVVFAVPAAGTNAIFELDVTLYEVQGGYRAIGALKQGLNGMRMSSTGTGFDNAIDQAVSIGVTMTGAGDSVNVYRTDVYLMG